MSLRRLDLLISEAREETENKEFTATTGISDEEFIRYANDGQMELQQAISNTHPDVFQEESDPISAIGESISIPSDAFLGNRIDYVEFSDDGSENNYRQLKQGRLSERRPGVNSTPSYYIRRSGILLLQPQPDSPGGVVRITYQKRLPSLDIRRAQVGAVTLGSDSITSLILDTTVNFDQENLVTDNFMTVIGRDGTIKMKGIEFDDISASTGIVTITSGFTFDTGETIEVGDYVVRGSCATTHSQLADVCEPFIVSFMQWRALKRDSSSDASGKGQELAQMRASIIDSFSQTDSDVDYVTILDSQYFSTEDLN